jgi:hypothetical protein
LRVKRRRQNQEDERRRHQRDIQPSNERHRGGGKSNGDGDGNGECRVPPSRDLAATAPVLAAEAVAALIADDADGGNSGVAIVGSVSLAAGGGVIN